MKKGYEIWYMEDGCVVMNWIKLAPDRGKWWALVTVVINLQVP
jgi:hypothetical protein